MNVFMKLLFVIFCLSFSSSSFSSPNINDSILEFANGKYKEYKNDGTGKSKGIKFNLKYPVTWKAEEGNRPNVVQKFVDRNGKGFAIFMILIKDFPVEEKITQRDIEELISSEDINSFLPENGILLGKGHMVLEQQQGFWLKYKGESGRGRNRISINTIAYNIFYNGKFISLQGQVADKVNGESLGYSFEYFEKLFDLMVNTLIFPDLYK